MMIERSAEIETREDECRMHRGCMGTAHGSDTMTVVSNGATKPPSQAAIRYMVELIDQ
jgi:hypothetical protein